MSDYTYAAAGAVAPSVLGHLTLHVDAARNRGETGLGPVPDERAIARMIDAAFWASLRREEGMQPKISLAFLRRDEAAYPLVLERSIPLEAAALTRLAAIVERPGMHLGVAYQGSELLVWGRSAPSRSTAASSRSPSRACSSSSITAARRRPSSSTWRCCRATGQGGRRRRVEPAGLPVAADVAAGIRFAVDMGGQRQRAGAARGLDACAWPRRRDAGGAGRHGCVAAIDGASAVVRSLAAVQRAGDLASGPADGVSKRAWREELNRAVDAVAGLTAIDGATVMTAGITC